MGDGGGGVVVDMMDDRGEGEKGKRGKGEKTVDDEATGDRRIYLLRRKDNEEI